MNSDSAPPPLAALDSSLVERQTRNNRETAGCWDLYEGHRSRVNSLIESEAASARLCVLGAGNSNSFDLESLANRFGEVHLCDLDAAALELGLERQARSARSKITLHSPVDVSGVLERLPEWAKAPPSVETLRAVPEAVAAKVVRALPGPFDVVVSEGLLSQILFTCFKAIGDGPVLMRVLPFVLLGHLRVLVALAKTGGACWLVTDTAFTAGVSAQKALDEVDGRALLDELDRQGKLFTGTSPALLTRALAEPGLSERVEALRFVTPWQWQFLPQRSALVYAVTFRRRDDA